MPLRLPLKIFSPTGNIIRKRLGPIFGFVWLCLGIWPCKHKTAPFRGGLISGGDLIATSAERRSS